MESKNSKGNGKCRWFGCHLIGVISVAFGFTLVIFFPDFFHAQLLKNLELRLDSRTYSEWKKPTVPLYMDIYLFNWTNPHEIKNQSTKPSFEQLGPYRFREYPDKSNISFDENNTTVNYRKFSTYFFDAEGSNGSLSDVWTTVNMVALGAGNKAQDWNFFLQKGVSITLSRYNQKIHVTKSVGELLFDGYDDDMVKLSTLFENDTPFDKVGFFVKKNGTDELSGNYSVNTGVDDIFKLGSIARYNNLTQFPFYENECRKLKGSAGEFFQPEPSIEKPIYLFTPDMCRAIPYDYEKDIELHGVMGHRFTAGIRALDNGTIYDENKCFESEQSGLMNISICNYNHPMFMSFPHFYSADQIYVDAVEGLKPEKEKHQAYITLEPTTGITLEVTARFQTNLLMRQYAKHIPLFQNIPRVFLPIFWVEQKFVMDLDKASQIKFALDIPWMGRLLGVFLTVVGITLLSYYYLSKFYCRKRDIASNLTSKSDLGETVIVMKDPEMDPLMSRKKLVART